MQAPPKTLASTFRALAPRPTSRVRRASMATLPNRDEEVPFPAQMGSTKWLMPPMPRSRSQRHTETQEPRTVVTDAGSAEAKSCPGRRSRSGGQRDGRARGERGAVEGHRRLGRQEVEELVIQGLEPALVRQESEESQGPRDPSVELQGDAGAHVSLLGGSPLPPVALHDMDGALPDRPADQPLSDRNPLERAAGYAE